MNPPSSHSAADAAGFSSAREPDGDEGCGGVTAIIVLFHPEPEILRRAIDVLRPQVARIVLVCNSPLPDALHDLKERSGIEMLGDQANIGLASAQNLALRHCAARGDAFVLLLDQDSEPPPELVGALLEGYRTLAASGIAVAAVGPRLVDADTGVAWPFDGAKNTVTGCNEVEFLRASGSLIPLDALKSIGPFVDFLYIDHIDLEWCMRARALGYRSFGLASAAMKHRIGHGYVRFLGRMHPLHSGERNFYVFRNSMALLKLAHLPWRWKLNEIVRILPRAVFYALQDERPGRHLRCCLSGMLAGLRTRREQLAPSPHG